ncbi:hypothetical protein CBL_10980 [Carabus blaptoides fortunei]
MTAEAMAGYSESVTQRISGRDNLSLGRNSGVLRLVNGESETNRTGARQSEQGGREQERRWLAGLIETLYRVVLDPVWSCKARTPGRLHQHHEGKVQQMLHCDKTIQLSPKTSDT